MPTPSPSATFDRIGDFGFWAAMPKVQRWRETLAVRPSVVAAGSPVYADHLRGFLRARGSALSQCMDIAITHRSLDLATADRTPPLGATPAGSLRVSR